MTDERERARVNRADINSLHQRINELHSKIDHAIALLERRPDTRPLGPTRTATGELHLPGSNPFGTQTPEQLEDNPIPNAGPATAWTALQQARNRQP